MSLEKILNGNKVSLTEEEILLKDSNDLRDLESYNENLYKIKRQELYPSVQEQLDMIYWDKVNGTKIWQEIITEVKSKHPTGRRNPSFWDNIKSILGI